MRADGAMPNASYERYVEVNMGFSKAFIYRVHPEGFYSQINMVLNAAAYSLIHKRRLMVDTRNIIGSWETYFGVTLPGSNMAMSWATDFLPRRYGWLRYRGGLMLLQWAEKFHQTETLLDLPLLGFKGTVFSLYRLLASWLCSHPKPLRRIFEGDYIACHVRRGDKLIREGQFRDVSSYLDSIRKSAPNIKNIFVMTDDYGVVEDFRSQAPDYQIATFCQPHQRGYVNQTFRYQSKIQSRNQLAILQQEVAIACGSALFVGCYLSNVSRFVALMHDQPEKCISVDIQERWIPGLPNFQKPADWQP